MLGEESSSMINIHNQLSGKHNAVQTYYFVEKCVSIFLITHSLKVTIILMPLIGRLTLVALM